MTMTVPHAHVSHVTSGRKGEKVSSVTFGPALLHTNPSARRDDGKGRRSGATTETSDAIRALSAR